MNRTCLNCPTVACEQLIQGSTERGGEHGPRCITAHLPHQKLLCQPQHFQPLGRTAHGSGRAEDWEEQYCPKPRIPGKHKNNTTQRWSQINKSCLQGMTARQEEQVYPSSYPSGRQRYPSWTANCVQHHEHFVPHRQKTSLILHLIQLPMSTVTKHISIYSLPPSISSHTQKLNRLLNKKSSATLNTEKTTENYFCQEV